MIDQVLSCICEIAGADEGEIAPDTELFEEGILDSFGLVELLVQLESFGPARQTDARPGRKVRR